MADLDLTDITRSRVDLAGAVADERRARAEIDAALSAQRDAYARGDASGATAAADRVADAVKAHSRAEVSVESLRELVVELSEALLPPAGPEDAVTSLTADVPVLLLPARLETRFAEDGRRLDVRIFPDQVHVIAHDPAATADELEGLTWYWRHRARDLDDEHLRDEAWQVLSTRLRPSRAAFLVRTYPPKRWSGGADPVFPDIPLRAPGDSMPARASLLPDRWCVLGFTRNSVGETSEVFRVWGAPIPDTLTAGVGSTASRPAEAGGLPADPGLAWTHDPGAAERVGMLVRIRQADCVPGFPLSGGVDRLLAVGVDWTQTPDKAADAVEAQLQAHADEGHLAFVRQGAPTNSTGRERSGFSTDAAAARSALAPNGTPEPSADWAASHFAKDLGIADEGLLRVPGADLQEQRWQSALLQALWPATGGYFLTEMLDPIADDPAINAALRRHVVAHVRASGPSSTIRVGAQPYGLLPVVARGSYRPSHQSSAESIVWRGAEDMRRLFSPLVADVPQLASVRSSGDVDKVTVALLTRTPVPWSLSVRQLIGPVQGHAMGSGWTKANEYQRTLTAILLNELGIVEPPLLAELTHEPREHPIDIPLVLGFDGAERGTAYLAEIAELLRRVDARTILDGRQKATALLESMVACAAVRAIDGAAKATAREALPLFTPTEEFVALVSTMAERLPYSLRVEVPSGRGGSEPAMLWTPADLSQTVIPAVTGTETLAATVMQQLPAVEFARVLEEPANPLSELAELAHGVESLVDAPPEQLEWAFRGTLDLFATRLDAWFTSLATARLRADRSAGASGLHVGGWAAVEDLRRDSGPASESLGFIHAPSLAQAASAAVLRSARTSHADASGAIFDLDLSSRRVRHALRIVEGVSAGQRLAALLGYRFERMLQDRDLTLAQWILPLRFQCPLRSDRPEDDAAPQTPAWSPGDPPTAIESVAARDVVDGVALLARWGSEGDALLKVAGIAAQARGAVGQVLDDLAALADAVSDLLVAEAVHQATSGNLERAGAALAAHDRQGPPPSAEFVRTPRAGNTVAQRVGLWLDADATTPAPGWPADIRSIAEPRLDRWLGTVFGAPQSWQVGGRLIHPVPGDPAAVPPIPASSDVIHELDPVRVDSLGLSALTVVVAASRPGTGHDTELEARVAEALAAQALARGIPIDGRLDRIELTDGLAELRELTRLAATLLGATPLGSADLADTTDLGRPPVKTVDVDVDEAGRRGDSLLKALASLVTELDRRRKALAARPDDDERVAAVSKALTDLFPALGGDALPPLDRSLIETEAERVSASATARLTAIAQLTPTAAPAAGASPLDSPVDDPAVVDARNRVRIALGQGQPFLPVVRATEPERMNASLAGRDELLKQDPHAVVAWLHGRALVRPELGEVSALLLRAEALGADVADDFKLLQLPHQPGSAWTALPYAVRDGAPIVPRQGTIALALHAPFGLAPAAGGAGVMIDAWTETVPAADETTAVSFHYDAPGARAPQTMLLAVRPEPDLTHWNLDAITGAVHEALELARLRALGPRELAPLSTLLPALFLPDGYSHDTGGLHLKELLGNLEERNIVGVVGDHVAGKWASHG